MSDPLRTKATTEAALAASLPVLVVDVAQPGGARVARFEPARRQAQREPAWDGPRDPSADRTGAGAAEARLLLVVHTVSAQLLALGHGEPPESAPPPQHAMLEPTVLHARAFGPADADADLQLRHPQLGLVTVAMALRDGALEVTFGAASARAARALQGEQGRLRARLHRAGIALGAVNVNVRRAGRRTRQENHHGN